MVGVGTFVGDVFIVGDGFLVGALVGLFVTIFVGVAPEGDALGDNVADGETVRDGLIVMDADGLAPAKLTVQ